MRDLRVRSARNGERNNKSGARHQAWGGLDSVAQMLGMKPQVLLDETGDEKVTVVVALVAVELQRISTGFGSR